jgi:hypothetical protein
MRKIFLAIAILISTISISQNDLFAMNTSCNTNHNSIIFKQPEIYHPIDLKLGKYKYKDPADAKNVGIAILLAGIAFTTASILEGGSQYGTYVNGTGINSNTTTYVTPPFWKQTPRQIMLCAGVALSLTGIITIARN